MLWLLRSSMVSRCSFGQSFVNMGSIQLFLLTVYDYLSSLPFLLPSIYCRTSIVTVPNILCSGSTGDRLLTSRLGLRIVGVVSTSRFELPSKLPNFTIPNMLPRPRLRPNGLRNVFRQPVASRRSITAAPKPGSGPLMERRADRALPTISNASFRWLRTLPIFAAIMVASTLGIFNYQKQSSSVVSSTLYALRTNQEARQILGDEIYFAHKIPWISGEINQLHGRINISFWVKGTKGRGLMKFRSERKTRMGYVSVAV
jgi:cytochrome c oxidase assembly factor 1